MRSYVVAWLSHFMPNTVAASLAPGWFSCIGLAGLFGLLLMLRGARKRGVDQGVIASVVLWCYLTAVAAGIIMPMTIDAFEQLFTTGHVTVRWSGMTSFWGYLAGGIAVAIVCRHHRVPLARLGDIAAIPMGVALVFARLGCYLGGCDYGKVTSVPWAVRFPAGSAAWRDHLQSGLLPPERAESLAVHPTQLYEALLGLVIVGVAVWAGRRAWREGRVFLAAAATYAIGRMIVEAFRADLGRGIYFGLSSGQIFSICVLVAIAVGLFASHRRLLAVAASAALALVVFDPHPAEAQPAPPYGQPAPPPPYQPPYQPPYGTPAPPSDRPFVAPQPLPDAGVRTAAPAPQAARSPIRLQVGLLGALAIPINRRADQVSTLAGPSLSIGVTGELLGLWVDLDSLGNRDAAHGTLLFSAGVMSRVAGTKFRIGGRVGAGPTLVNFDEDAFHDVGGTTVRFEAIGELVVAKNLMIAVRPLTFDILSSRDLGGPITTWQTRVGLVYSFDIRSARSASPRSAAPPPVQPPPEPYAPPYAPPYQPTQPVSRIP